MKNILFAASECVPFIKTGGLADVVGALPGAIDKNFFDVRVILPKYSCMEEKFQEQLRYLTHFYMDFNGGSKYVGVLALEHEGITVYFIDNEEYFSGEKPYCEYHQDIEKFIFFDKAVLSALPLIGFRPDVIHCHDWQTGLIPVFLKDCFAGNLFFLGIKSVMTIHNLKFQGNDDRKVIQRISGLSDYYFTIDKLAVKLDANLLKGGIVYADAVTTVSETYAEEIKKAQYGEGLEGLLLARSHDLRGILNGIDVRTYNPRRDEQICCPYNLVNFRKNKPQNKLALQKDLGLAEGAEPFLIGIVSRLTDQKGFDLIAEVMEELLCDNVQIAALGTGEAVYEEMFRCFAEKYPNKVSATLRYSETLSRKIYAGSDAFLMPSRFEPCGLSQLIALRYGTLPIVRETGGLKDTVAPYNEYEDTGTGFSFTDYNAQDMLYTIRYAESVFRGNRAAWQNMMRRAMKEDFSWTASAAKYQEMYDWLVGKREES